MRTTIGIILLFLKLSGIQSHQRWVIAQESYTRERIGVRVPNSSNEFNQPSSVTPSPEKGRLK
jgi:hypothetical protein